MQKTLQGPDQQAACVVCMHAQVPCSSHAGSPAGMATSSRLMFQDQCMARSSAEGRTTLWIGGLGRMGCTASGQRPHAQQDVQRTSAQPKCTAFSCPVVCSPAMAARKVPMTCSRGWGAVSSRASRTCITTHWIDAVLIHLDTTSPDNSGLTHTLQLPAWACLRAEQLTD